jgi:hypothetical protein
MKIIRVQYTVKDKFAVQNKANIAAVMQELKATENTDVKYFATVQNDGKSFMHVVMYKNSEAESLPASLDSFALFQKELKENVEVPPHVETLEVVGSSFDLF